MSWPDPDDPVLNAREAAALLGIHVNTFKRLVHRRDFLVWRIGARGDIKLHRSEVERYKREGPRSRG